MRRIMLLLTLALPACSDGGASIFSIEDIPAVTAPGDAPHALFDLIESTSTYERIRLAGFLNGNAGPLNYRYRIVLIVGSGIGAYAVEEVAWTQWSTSAPTIRVDRHATYERVLLWEVRDGTSGEFSTSLHAVAPR